MNRLRSLVTLLAFILVLASGAMSLHAVGLGDMFETRIYLALIVCLIVVIAVRMWRVTLAAIVVCAGLLFYHGRVRSAETAALRPIAAIAKKIVESSRNGGPWRLQSFQNRLNPEPPQETSVEPPMTGKALVWDVPGDRLSWAYYRLPFALRAKPADPAMTIFMVWETRSEKILDYKVTVTHKDGRTESLPSVGGFRETVDVGVVRWPEKRMIEWHSVVGAAPPEEIHTTVRVKSGKAQSPGSVRADVSEPLLMWIRSMEKVP